jgi:phosphopantetheinyl transferase
MPLSYISKLGGDVKLGFWQMGESSEALLKICAIHPYEFDDYAAINHEKVKRQWLSTRLLAQKMCGEKAQVYYDDYGKPHCFGFGGISISHSGDYVLLATDPNNAIGVDIELISQKIIRVKDKFISLEEEELFEYIRNEKLFMFYHLVWSFKEAAYKLYGKKGLIFKKHIILKELLTHELNTINGVLMVNNKEVAITGNFLFIGGYVICTCKYR